jgi:hypothetical protein
MRTTQLQTLVLVSTVLALTGSIAHGQTRPVPQAPTGTVTLPVADYDRLIDRASQPPTTTTPPPVAAVAGRAELTATVSATGVRGTIRIDGEVFHQGPVKVPLVTGATLLDARADGRPLPLLHESEVHAAILVGPAPFSVTLEWMAPLGAAPGRASFTLPQPSSSSVNAIVDLPGDPADVRVEPGIVTRRQTASGRTTIEAALDRGRRTQVSWSVREGATQSAPVDARALSDVKTLVTIGDGDLRLVALVDITVVRGEPRTFDVQLPAGYEVASVTGSSLDGSETKGTTLALTVRDPSQRRHQFLISLEQPRGPGSFNADASFPTVVGVQREAGEVAIEGIGTIEVSATGDDTMRRMDVREAHASLRSLARQPLLAAFRYQRRPNESRSLTLDVKRFTDAAVIAAAAERATATTLVTAEGRMLTEVALVIRNRAQPFMKVTLPPGATMLSVDVAGETAKPVLGVDGTRIPLLRAGFRPDGPYMVSFVYLHAGQALAKRGQAQMSLPTFDVPVTLLEWELFLPGQYSAKPIAGNVLPASLVERTTAGFAWAAGGAAHIGGELRIARGDVQGGIVAGPPHALLDAPGTGQIVGRVVDSSGAHLPGATIVATVNGQRLSATTDATGVYVIRGVPSGTVGITSDLQGFNTVRQTVTFDQQPRRIDFRMAIGETTETITVIAEEALLNSALASRSVTNAAADRAVERPSPEPAQVAPSQNVINLQRRVAGVLPVRVDVPRAGTQYRFVRPLVLEEETTVSFKYKTR